MATAKRKVGRPTKYDPAFVEELIAFMNRGYSLTAFAGSIGVARSTINVWMAENPEFSEAAEIGQAARTRKLEETLLKGESGPKVTAHIFAIKNADPEGWRDTTRNELVGAKDAPPVQTEVNVRFV